MKNLNSLQGATLSKTLLLSIFCITLYGFSTNNSLFKASPKNHVLSSLQDIVCSIENLNAQKKYASCAELVNLQLEINQLRSLAFNITDQAVAIAPVPDPIALCPTIESIELIDVAGFASTDRLVICGEPDTLAFVIFIEEPGEILGAQMSVSFQPGMQYAGFELTHYDGTSISNLNPDPQKPEFLLEGITDAIYIAYIGVEANCDADINGLEYRVDLEYNFTYQDTFGNIQNCRQKAEPARVYNSTIKQPILNYRSAGVTTISGLSEEYCRTIEISQDGIDAYLQELEFSVCGIDLDNELTLTRTLVNNIPIASSYSSADSILTLNIDDSYFAGNSTPNPADNYFNENEKVNITLCYEVTDCPLENTQIITYKAAWGCNGEFCQVATSSSEIRLRPNTQPDPFTTVTKLTNPTVCGEPGLIELNMYAVQAGSNIAVTDSAAGLFTDLTLGFETCDQSTLVVGGVLLGSTYLPAENFSWVNGDLIVDFMDLTTDPDGPGGITDADGDGFYDDLPGGEELTLRIELDFVCMPPVDGSSVSCSSVDCSFAKFFVAAKRDCGQSFTYFPEIEEFNIINGATFVESKELVLINNSFYGINFGIVGNDGNCNPRPESVQTVEFCYIYEVENVNTCATASTNEMQVTFSGSPAAVYDIQIVPNSVELTVDGVTTVSNENGTFTDFDSDTRILNIPFGSPEIGEEICYKYQLVADTALCIPAQYMAGTHQVLERCVTPDCSCTLVKACDAVQFRLDPADCNCDCDISSGATVRRWNLGYTDGTLTEKVDLEDVPVEDLTRFLPCDTMYYEGWMSFNSETALSELYQWYFVGNMTQLGSNGWGSDELELMVDASGSELLQLEFVKQGSTIRQNMDMSAFSECVDKPETGATGFFSYSADDPWGDEVYNTPMCSSTYEFHDGNLFGVYFRNFNTLEDCRELERDDWEESNCLDQIKAHFNIEVGDTIYMKFLLPLTKNVKAAARKIVEPDFQFELPQMINVASGHYIDEFDTDCLLSLTNCRENTPFTTYCPSDINAVTSINIDDCGGEVMHDFNVVNTTPVNWFTEEYRPYFKMQDIRVPIYTPTMFCGNAVLVSEAGVEYPLEVKNYENHECVAVGVDEYCPVADGNVGHITFNLADNGYPGMGVGLGGYLDKFTIKYDLCKICPTELSDLSDYEIEYKYNTCETLDPSCFRCWLRVDGSYNQLPSICSRDGSTPVAHGGSYYDAFDLDTLFLFEGVSEDYNVTDISNGFAALSQTPDRLLLGSAAPGTSIEYNTIEVCADGADLSLETHKSVTGSITITNSIALASVLDAAGNPIPFNFVTSTPSTSTYSFPMDDLPPGECAEVQIGTTLLYCPEDPDVAQLCLTVTSGCLDRDILAAVVGNAAGCNEIETCYEYVTEEANLQANFLNPSGEEYPLCAEIPVAALVKNVQIATLTDLALEFELPLNGASIVPGSFMASYPNNSDLSGATPFYSIPDPMINGNILSYPEDDDFSNHIHMNGFPGVLSSLDSNYITIKFLVKTDCDEFVSGSIATFEATAIDPCSPNTLSSGVVNSDQFIIEGGNPNDYAKVLVSAKPLQAYCGQSNAEFKVTGLNISERPSGDSVQMCITLPEELTYVPGSMAYVIPASQSVGVETVTVIGTQTQVCFAGYNNMPVGGQFTLSFEANFEEDTPCGDYKVGVDIKELRPSEVCADGGTCDLFVQSSVNPDFTVELKGPLQTTRLQLTRSCDGGNDPVTMCYEADIENPGEDYSGTVTVNLHEDLTGNGVFDYFDPIIGTMDFPGTLVLDGELVTLKGCFEVPLAKACPVILNIVFETECNCDNNVLPFTEVVPSFAIDLPSQIFLCPGEELALDTCSNYIITYDPASNVTTRTTNDSLYIGLIDPTIATDMILTGISGDCETYEPFTLEGIEALELMLAETETCQNIPLTLELDLPSKYHDFVEISWMPTSNLDDPTLLDPVFTSDVPGDYEYTVTMKISETCDIVTDVVVTVLPNGELSIGGDDLFCFDYSPSPATLTSDPGYDYYEWYRLVGSFEVISASTPTNVWNGPIIAGDYIVKAFRSTDPCPSVSGIHTLNSKECVDLKFYKNVINVPSPFTLESQVTYEMVVCNVNDPSIGMIFDETDVQIIDQLPGGVSYLGHAHTTGSYSPGSNEWNIDILENGTCDTLWIDVQVDDYGCIINDAQITMGMHEDVDSTPNNDDGDQSEDDEDFAKVEVDTFDLALTKKLSPMQTIPVTIGSTVTYDIEVCNQAEIDAYNIEVVDYVPAGMSVDLSLNPTWNAGSVSSEYFATIPRPITPGNCETIQLISTVDVIPVSGSYVNFAEINNAEDVNGNNPPDLDSEADNDPANDGDFVDNETGNSAGDEDDHDPAEIAVVLVDCQIANNVPVCPENAIVLTEIGMDIVSWNWTGPNGFTSTSSSLTIDPPIEGIYKVTVTDSNGLTNECQVETMIHTEMVISGEITNASCKDANDGSVDLTIVGGSLPYSFDWSNDGPDAPDNDPQNITGLKDGTYFVTVVDANDCEKILSFDISEPELLECQLLKEDVLCYGEASGTINVKARGGSGAYEYSLNGGPYQPGDIFEDLEAGDYIMTVRDENGCEAECSITVSEPEELTCLISATDDTSCTEDNGVIVVNAMGGTPNYEYSIDGGVTFQTSSLFPALGAGEYVVTVKDENGCESSCTVTLTSPTLPICSVSSNIGVSCDGGSDGILVADGSLGSGNYEYSINGVDWQVSGIFTDLEAGPYVISIRNVETPTCVSQCSIILTEPQALICSLTGIDPSCTDGDDGSISVIVSGGQENYEYSIDGGLSWQLSNIFDDLTANDYSVLVRDNGDDACVTSCDITLEEPMILSCSIESTALDCNGDSSGGIAITTTGGTLPYEYSLNGGGWQPGNVYLGLSAGNYVVTVRDGNGCLSICNTTITEPSALSCSLIASDATDCNTDDGTINVAVNGGTGPYSYSLDGGAYTSSSSFNNLMPGTHLISVQDVNGCLSTCEAEINAPDTPMCQISSVTHVECFGATTGAVTVIGSAGNPPYEFSMDNLVWQANGVFNNLEAGTYNIYIRNTDNPLCTSMCAVEINEPEELECLLISNEPLCHGSLTGNITVLATEGTPGYEYSLDGGAWQPGHVFNNLGAGSYTVTTRDANDCTKNCTIVISEPPVLSCSASFEDLLCFEDNSGSINVTASGGVAPYDYNLNGGFWQDGHIFENLEAGTYTITVRDAHQCITTCDVTIEQPPILSCDLINIRPESCAFNDGGILVQGLGGTAPFTYSIDDGATSNGSGIFNDLTPGNYEILIEDSNGCIVTCNYEILPDCYDLALEKNLVTEGPYNYGDYVIFEIDVENQGNIDAFDVEITDHLPCGFSYDPGRLINLANNWTLFPTAFPMTEIESLPTGESVTLIIEVKIEPCADLGGYINVAEITNDDGGDVDSDPDYDPTNDPDSEDDHDTELVEVYDLSLTKKLITPEPYKYGDILEFAIEVCNQAANPVMNITISDYVPVGYSFDASLNSGWMGAGPTPTSLTYEYSTPLLYGDECITIPLFLKLEMAGGTDDWKNVSEISEFQDEDGTVQEDVDSTPDNDPTNDGPMEDNATDGTNGDEDDSDFAGPEIIDAALIKTTADVGPFSYGDTITFDIEVFNQGNVDLQNIVVNDFVPCGYSFLGSNAPDWNYDSGASIASTIMSGPLAPGASEVVSIQFEIQSCVDAPSGAWTNTSELESFENLDGEDVTDEDIDSEADTDPNNDSTEDDTNDNSNGDEDDHDPEMIEIYDLAQVKRLLTAGPYAYGDLLEYEICVINQGNVEANFIELTDHLPSGLSFASANNIGWDAANAPAYTYGITSALASGDTVCVKMFANIVMTNGGVDNYLNVSEISGDDGDDADSEADDDPNNDGDTIDDSYEDEEDDHDPENFEIIDAALIKTTSDVGPFSYGDVITFDIEVFNQGNVDLQNIVVNDFLPCGYSFLGSNAPDWNYHSGTSIASTTMSGPLAPGASEVLSIQFEIQSCVDAPSGAWTNTSELESFENLDGEDVTDEDIDSEADTDPSNDSTEDDTNDNSNGDEDDHDPEMIEIYDLAQVKRLLTAGPYSYGDLLEYEICVINQGNVEANFIELTDHLPSGLSFASINDIRWDTINAPAYTFQINSALVPGDTVCVKMYANLIRTDGGADSYTNVSEISADDGDDADSEEDADPNNDGDVINDSYEDDEDDHDQETLEIFDLALSKKIFNQADPSSFQQGDPVQYLIEVFNQGNIPAYNIQVCDHIPAGFIFDPSQNIDWTGSANAPTTICTTISGPIEPGYNFQLGVILEIQSLGLEATLEDYTNYAEITMAENEDGEEMDDLDSNPDDDPVNDGEYVDDAIDDENDEDDNDPALPYFMDLALKKELAFEYTAVAPGDVITYNLTVYNQGTLDAFNVEVTEYSPPGLILSATDGNGWTGVGPNYTNIIPGPISLGDSAVVQIEMVVQPFMNEDDYLNAAEISAHEDVNGNDPEDFDSAPDDDESNDGEMTDNEIDGENNDEDDSDFESLVVVDLALIKTVKELEPVVEGDDVCFTIEVYNQGNIPVANVLVNDYIPSGFLLSLNDQNGWIDVNPALATNVIAGPINPLASQSVEIVLTVQPDASLANLMNVAEIGSFEDTSGTDISDYDVDSDPDNDPENDGVMEDDDIDGTNGDEDDSDPAWPPIFDLSLIKTTDNTDPVIPGQVISYTIEVCNQGNIAAQNILITDYPEAGLALASSDGNGWTQNTDGSMSLLYTGIIGPDKCETVQIDMEVQLIATAENTMNFAEIETSEDDQGNDTTDDDIDSDADDDENNDDYTSDDDHTSTGGDEDDHDGELLPIFDLALRKFVDNPGPYALGANVQFDIEICNQGNMTAQNIEVVDYIPSGLAFATDGSNAAWTLINPSLATTTYTGQIAPGACVEIPIWLSTESVEPTALVNMAEISGAQDDTGEDRTNDDVDSFADADNSNDNGNDLFSDLNDFNDQSSYTGGDEDDHDQAWVIVCVDFECQGHLNVSLDASCSVSLTPAMLLDLDLDFPVTSYEAFEIIITDQAGNVVENLFGADDIGVTYNVTVNLPNCVSGTCITTITIEDKYGPVLNCNSGPFDVPCNGINQVPPPTATENCGAYEIIMIDEVEEVFECDELVGRITRTWVGVDESGNQSVVPCVQIINVVRPDFSSIALAETNISINCSEIVELDSNGYPAPWVHPTTGSGTGVPIMCVSGFEFGADCTTGIGPGDGIFLIPGPQEEVCNTTVTYEDALIPTNDCTVKIMRRFEVTESWCGSTLVWSGTQTIEIMDDIDPVITCPSDFTVSTDIGCEAEVVLPVAQVEDICGSVVNVDVQVEGNAMGFPGAFVDGNGGITNLPVGENIVNYIVYDACYNSSSCSMVVTVEDNTEPVAICEQNLVVSLPSNGVAEVWAQSFDDGSFDECDISAYEVTRMVSTCNPEDEMIWDDVVSFCCDDLLQDVMVILRVWDHSGNYNQCMINVTVQDKTTPTLTCPADMAAPCNTPYDLSNLSATFGSPNVVDNCSLNTISEVVTPDVASCGTGTITRDFSVLDYEGNVAATCTQVITLVQVDPMTEADIDWPDNYELFDVCDVGAAHPNLLPVEASYPVVMEGVCDLVGHNYEDEIFTNVAGAGACAKILRHWQIINWCQTDADGNLLIWEWTQVIQIYNTIDPVIDNDCSKLTFTSTDVNCGPVSIVLTNSATDDCSQPSDLSWSWNIDMYSDNAVVNDISGTGSNASGTYPIGLHTITWTVEDACGNIDFCVQEFEIINTKTPTAICLSGISSELIPMDLDGDGNPDTEMVVLNSASFDGGSYHTCGYPVDVSFSADVNDDLIAFGCNQVGVQSISLWVTDVNGNTAVCQTFVNITNNLDEGLCTGLIQMVDVEGRVVTENDEEVNEVMVNLSGSNLMEMTDYKGVYDFDEMPTGGAYAIVPSKNDNVLNGVSTLDVIHIQRHILGLATLPTPYQYIAADANKSRTISGIDLVHIRKVILGISDSFQNNNSWRFIDGNFDFDPEIDPLAQEFTERYEIKSLNTDMIADFVGVKIGDVNGSVDVGNNLIGKAEARSSQRLELHGRVNGHQIDVRNSFDKSLRGFQMTIDYDPSLMSVQAIKSAVIDLEKNSYHINPEEGYITISWNDTKTVLIENNEVLFSIEAEGSLDENAIDINSSITIAEAYDDEFQIMEIEYLNSSDLVENILYQNEPNPWISSTTIKFDLAEEKDVRFIFRDTEGKLLKTIDMSGVQGTNIIEVNADELEATGMVYYELQVGEERITKKMILLK